MEVMLEGNALTIIGISDIARDIVADAIAVRGSAIPTAGSVTGRSSRPMAQEKARGIG